MKRLSFRLIALALTFMLGFAAVVLWRTATTFSFFGSSQTLATTKQSTLSQSSERIGRSGIEEEEYAVYSALLNDGGPHTKTDRLLVIIDQPSPWVSFSDEENDKFYADLKKSSSVLMSETVDDLQAKNKEHYTLTRRFNTKSQYVLISEKEMKDFFKQGVGDGWGKFYKKYPGSGGFLTFSRVGFNADKTQALVYHAYSCGGLCGGGTYYLLIKKNSVWVVKGSIGPAWVS